MSQALESDPAIGLYDRDFYLWILDTAERLKKRDFDHLDLNHLIDEVESLGRSEKREILNRAEILLQHLLKRCYPPQPENYRGWELIVREQWRQLQRNLRDSPSLSQVLLENLPELLQETAETVQLEYPDSRIPSQLPVELTLSALLSESFWLDPPSSTPSHSP
ncbi:DUF29 domain-containing protein [Synechococcus sp. W60.1]|uniref:DUF29 domain-containing protein n=1 Tax=Synechococcus sp. W60.1 TaxID=2964516 RepID=UPI0039C1A6C7